MNTNYRLLPILLMFFFDGAIQAEEQQSQSDLFAKDNLVAWCIVPFDASQRGPKERAEMLNRLGLRKVAYDWRKQHVSTFEDEILQYKAHDLEFFAFWSWHEDFIALVKKHDIHPQFWLTNPSPPGDSDIAKVEAAAQQLLPRVKQAAELGCQFGLYNHGGWGGDPKNLVAVCEHLKQQHQLNNVGIVYNFHHGHAHIDDFAESLKLMLPHLLCVNINGMADPSTVKGHTNKIITLGQGKHEQSMLKTLQASGYHGPIGILDHRNELDTEESLKANLDGLRTLIE